MPPTLHIGIPSIHPSIGLSVQLPWNSSQNIPNGSSINGKDEIHHNHGHMSVFAENFTYRGVEGMHRQFMNSGNVVNNGPSILPVPAGYLNGPDSDDSARRAMQMSMSRPHDLHPIVGFGSDDYSVASYSAPPHQYGHGGDNIFVHPGEAPSGFGEDELSATFAMYRFKVEKCSKQFVHDWKECPYAHEGETARRRHPSTHSAQPCPDFKNSKSCARYVRSKCCPLCLPLTYSESGEICARWLMVHGRLGCTRMRIGQIFVHMAMNASEGCASSRTTIPS